MALAVHPAWYYFSRSSSAAALTALRGRMGTSFATSPVDADLLVILGRCVAMLEAATGRFFIPRAGQLGVDGTDSPRLFLPHPIVSTDQLAGGGVTEILVDGDTDAVTTDLYVVNDGAMPGDEDPRDDPFVEYVPSDTVPRSLPPTYVGRANRWPEGVRNVKVTGTWGYLDESGATPELVLHALARLCVMQSGANDDPAAIFDRRAGAIFTETTRDRSYTLAAGGVGGGLTTDREIDLIIARLRKPPQARISRPRRRRARSRYYL
jgi:hypothetical protein